ncbi:hypothetical protein CABS01_16453 [Colletotrichum abscissum]|uniref:uncharacterized protein n=1 Tax=Colletotrichum abscissum TaxID=1671311 RepID=UPI0027D6C89A|nr:uncharacterized protein CABS01_16453 [Colletotrichum abscissum]KAK1471191.1 hypothetical protein CABS01_16453 [Colletotrichum abscissum]
MVGPGRECTICVALTYLSIGTVNRAHTRVATGMHRARSATNIFGVLLMTDDEECHQWATQGLKEAQRSAERAIAHLSGEAVLRLPSAESRQLAVGSGSNDARQPAVCIFFTLHPPSRMGSSANSVRTCQGNAGFSSPQAGGSCRTVRVWLIVRTRQTANWLESWSRFGEACPAARGECRIASATIGMAASMQRRHRVLRSVLVLLVRSPTLMCLPSHRMRMVGIPHTLASYGDEPRWLADTVRYQPPLLQYAVPCRPRSSASGPREASSRRTLVRASALFVGNGAPHASLPRRSVLLTTTSTAPSLFRVGFNQRYGVARPSAQTERLYGYRLRSSGCVALLFRLGRCRTTHL